MCCLKDFIGHQSLATLLRSSIPRQLAVPDEGGQSDQEPLLPQSSPDGQISPAEQAPSLLEEQNGLYRPPEAIASPASETGQSTDGYFPDTAITREIIREVNEREGEQRAKSSWAVPRKPRPFKASSKPTPPSKSLTGDFDAANLPFRLRLISLFYRCRLTTLEDSVHMITALDRLAPPSKHTSMMVNGLRSLTTTQVQENITALDGTIGECHTRKLKRLEVELRLVQISFHSVLSLLKTSSGVDIQGSMRVMLDLCRQYPDTAGLFLSSVVSIKRALETGRQDWKIELDSMAANAFWKKWAGHEVGFLRHCIHGHPYSGYVFSDCPECGRYVEPKSKEQDTTHYASFLKEDQFVAKMKTMRLNPHRAESFPKGTNGH